MLVVIIRRMTFYYLFSTFIQKNTKQCTNVRIHYLRVKKNIVYLMLRQAAFIFPLATNRTRGITITK